jgi:two-component system, OmpR family, sensor histidine kinase QseC
MKLSTIVFRRIATVVLLALTIQVAVTLAECLLDEDYYGKHYIEIEASRVAEAARIENGRLVLNLSSSLPHYVNRYASDYSLRILDMDGEVLFASNQALLERVVPSRTPIPGIHFWLGQLDRAKSFHIAGGVLATIDDRTVLIETATRGDPAFVRMHVLISEFIKDVWIPMGPLVLLTIFIAPYSVHRTLRPLARAAQQADVLKATDYEARFSLADLPREAASFAAAINRLMDRVGELVQSQKLFISRAAHELRTPLSIILLELGKIADPRARRATGDVMDMSNTVDRLLQLARIDAMAECEAADIDLAAITHQAVDKLKPLAQARDVSINLNVQSPQLFQGDPASIYEAIRNLVENAIKHTPPGTRIVITCGPAFSWTIEDNGGGLPEDDVQSLFEPFRRGRINGDGAGLGLAIVKQTMELHGGSIEAGRSSMNGAKFSLRFSPKPQDVLDRRVPARDLACAT